MGFLINSAVVVVAALIIIIYTSFKWSYGYWRRKKMPYMEPTIPFGNLESPFDKKKVSLFDRTNKWYKFGKDRKLRHFGMFYAKSPVYFVLDLEIIKCILATDFEYWVNRGNFYNEKGDPLSAHLVNLGGERWKTLRKKITPTFTSGKMKQMFQTIAECGTFFEKAMDEKLLDKQPIDIKNMCANFTTEVIGSCAFGLECNSFSENSEFRYYGRKVFASDSIRAIKRNIKAAFPGLAKFLNLRSWDKETNDFFVKIIKDMVVHRKENNISRNDFLQILIELESELTMMEIAAQVFVFFIAGFETSANAMTFALFEMSLHQDVQEKARNEVMAVLAKHNGEINYDSIIEMKFMDQVIKETLRKYPPVSAITRECVKDYKVPGCDLIIEKGTLAVIPVAGIHTDADYYVNPEIFDPERFNDENKSNIKSFSYMGFGGGRRECLGKRFAIIETKVGLATLLRKYKFVLNEKTQMPLKIDPHQFITAAEGDVWLDYETI